MPTVRPNAFASGSLDRVSDQRRDEAWVQKHLDDPGTLVHIVWQGRLAVLDERAAGLAYANLRDLAGVFGPVLLGTLDGSGRRCTLDLSHVGRSAVESLLPADTMLSGLREAAVHLHGDDPNLLAFASGISTWHARLAVLRGLRGRDGGPPTPGTCASARGVGPSTSPAPTRR